MLRLAAMIALSGGTLWAQQGIGTVAVQDATVSGDLSVTNGRAVLVGSSSVTAKDHTANVDLSRGGTVRVCATSGLHLSEAHGLSDEPLMLALDRGAIEVHTTARAHDVIMTPDLRFSIPTQGPLDLRIRVTRNGDTCVENHGADAPTLNISDQFGESSYELRPEQHVLFEHGSLKEVVDHESSPCGCPPDAAPGMSIADALLAPGTPAPSPAAQDAEKQHPFPAAVSQGLAPSPAVPQAPAGVAHAQVATTLGYSSDGGGTISGNPAQPAQPSSSAAPEVTQPAPAPEEPKQKDSFFHKVGSFFRRIFG